MNKLSKFIQDLAFVTEKEHPHFPREVVYEGDEKSVTSK